MSQEQANSVGTSHPSPTLGEVAYNAYCNQSGWKSLASGADLPQFSETKQEIRDAWEVAAQAVVDFTAPLSKVA